MMPMQMYFEAGTNVTLWLHAWRTTSLTRYIISAVGLGLLAVAAESLGALRTRLARTGGDGMAVRPDVEGGSAASEPLLGFLSARASSSSRLNVLLALLYALNAAISYLLMLAVMTFNVGYFVAVVVGLGVGHYVTSNQRAKAATGDVCCPAP